MNQKPEIVFTFSSCMGGVASFNYNIINHSRLIKNFTSKVILLKEENDFRADFLDTFAVDEVITFNYSAKENQFYVQKRLSKLFGDSPGLIVTDNSLTVYASKAFNNQKTICFLIHDFYYVNQLIQLGDLVDFTISHSSFFNDTVYASNPELFVDRNYYIPYGVRQLNSFPIKKEGVLNLVFLGRLETSKGVMQLFEIDKLIQSHDVRVNWTIIGKGPLLNNLNEQLAQQNNFTFFQPDSTKEVYSLLNTHDILVLPTSFEGTPVSILECIANGVVPITYNLPGGIREIITDDIGFRCDLNNYQQISQRIVALHHGRDMLKTMQQNCFNLSKAQYSIENNSDNYFKLFLQFNVLKRKNKLNKIKRSRLDREMFPNSLVRLIRNNLKK